MLAYVDLKWFHTLFASLVLVLCISSSYVHGQNKIFSVSDYGAFADGKTDSSKAFLNAWKKACATNGGLIAVPLGTYFVSGAKFEGPCIGETYFETNGTLIASSNPSLDQDYWIFFYGVDDLTIFGNGTFDGNGASAWLHNGFACQRRRPSSIKFNTVRNVVVTGITSINSKMFHLHINQCDNMTVAKVNITAPSDSPNTDGIHIGKSNNISIINSHISTGDDCISVGDGSTNVNMTSIWCGPGHGISIGSLGRYEAEEDVRGITVKNVTFTNTNNGLRIKTWAPSSVSTTVSDVTFADIHIEDVENPIVIDQYYCPHSACSHEGESEIEINGVKFINIKGNSSSAVAVDIKCSKMRPCQNIEFTGLELTVKGTGQPTTAFCSNADDKFLGTDQVPSHCS